MSITLDRGGNTIRVPLTNAAPAANNRRGSVQSKLNETTFSQYLDGFQEIQATDLPNAKGRIRYVIDAVDGRGRIVSSQFRLGGWLSGVDPQLRYFQLFNPFAKKRWSVQLRKPGQRVRLYYMANATSDETALMRELLTKLENGNIRITKGRG